MAWNHSTHFCFVLKLLGEIKLTMELFAILGENDTSLGSGLNAIMSVLIMSPSLLMVRNLLMFVILLIR